MRDMQEVERNSDGTAYGRPTSGQNGSSPSFHKRWFRRFRPLEDMFSEDAGGAVTSKRWGLVFTCLGSRAVHIELLESIDASSFMSALRRFFAFRDPVSRGTNFIGAKSELGHTLREMDRRKVKGYVTNHGCEWIWNPPHASNFGGAWECQIGTICRVLDAMFAELGSHQLTHELLVTLMAEVTAVVNARPISALPTDVEELQPLSPSMLLTMKTHPLGPPPGNFVPPDVCARRRHRRVQYLADQFWIRWKGEYLQGMQTRTKWQGTRRNL